MRRTSRRLAVVAIAVVVAVIGSSGVAQATVPGHLDPLWGTGGIVEENVDGYVAYCTVPRYGSWPCGPMPRVADLLARDDRVVAVSPWRAGPTSTQKVEVVAFDARGVRDASFGIDGKVFLDSDASLSAMRVLAGPGDTTLVAWQDGTGIYVVRLLGNGAVDVSFGGSGAVRLPLSSGASSLSWLLPEVGPGGSLTFAARRVSPVSEVIVLRLGADGRLDATFGVGGLASFGVAPLPHLPPRDLVVRPDGRVVVLLSSGAGSYGTSALVALGTDGRLDATFGFGGIYVPFSGMPADEIALDRDGRLTVLATLEDLTGVNGWRTVVLTRLTDRGVVDLSFGVGGSFVLPYTQSVLVRGSELVIDGSGDPVFALEIGLLGVGTFAGVGRLNILGQLDLTFGNLTPGTSMIRSLPAFTALAVAPSGDIVGGTDRASGVPTCQMFCRELVLARLDGNGG